VHGLHVAQPTLKLMTAALLFVMRAADITCATKQFRRDNAVTGDIEMT
jgi:hypothetical protein